MKEERRARALERAHGEVADKTVKLLATIGAREAHIVAVAAAAALANEEKVLRAALHKADKEAAIVKAARAAEYARLQTLAGVLADEEARAAAADGKARLWRERQEAQRRLIIARDRLNDDAEKQAAVSDHAQAAA